MAEGNRARSALVRNLPKKGWEFDGNEGSFKDLKIVLGDEEWSMTKVEGGKSVDVATGFYGKTQMNEVKKAANSAGQPFAPVGKGGGGGGEGSGGTRGVDPEKKKIMAEKRAEKATVRQKESFTEILSGNGWEEDKKTTGQYKRDGFAVTLGPVDWSMSKGKKVVCEGTYASKAYAVIEAALEEKAS